MLFAHYIRIPLMLIGCVLVMCGCTQSDIKEDGARENLTLHSIRAAGSPTSLEDFSNQDLATLEASLQSLIAADEDRVSKAKFEIATLDQSLSDCDTTLMQLVTYFGQDLSSSVHISEEKLNASVREASFMIDAKQRELKQLQAETIQIENEATYAAESYLREQYDRIERDVEHRNLIREKIGAKKADQAEAQARAREQMQARIIGQPQYVTNVQTYIAANRKRQESLHSDIKMLNHYVEALNQLPRDVDTLASDIASAESRLNDINIAIGNNKRLLGEIRHEIRLRLEAEREQLARLAAIQREKARFAHQTPVQESVATGRGYNISSSNPPRGHQYFGTQSAARTISRRYDPSYRPEPNFQYIKGYTRRNGTAVSGHMRTARDTSYWNNMSSYGNRNPFTGKIGTRLPPFSSN